MIGLKKVGRKSYFRIALHALLIGGIGTAFIMLGNMVDENRNNYILERQKVISKYERVIKEKDSINTMLNNQQIILINKVDSLEDTKIQIVKSYDKKIKSIYDASAIEHAMWMESTIAQLDSIKAK